MNKIFIFLGFIPVFLFAQKDTIKKQEKILDEVTIYENKNFIKTEANKTTFLIKNNDLFSSGTGLDAVKKLPSVQYFANSININGKSAKIYIDGIPSELNGQDLMNYIQSLPANAIEKIEIIENPGAEYDAKSNSGIINIITQGKITKGLSGTLNTSLGLNNNQKYINSLLLNLKTKRYDLRFTIGFSDLNKNNLETYFREFNNLNKEYNIYSFHRIESLKKDNNLYLKPALNFKLNSKSNILFNYNLVYNNNKDFSEISTKSYNYFPEINEKNINSLKNQNTNHEFIANYINKLDTLGTKLSVTAYYSVFNKDQNTFSGTQKVLNLNQNLENYYLKSDFLYNLKSLNTNINTGFKINNLTYKSIANQNFTSKNIENIFDYSESNQALYLEANKKIQKFSINTGIRWENISTKNNFSSEKNELNSFFPSLNITYQVNKLLKINTNYNRKVETPNYNNVDPNISGNLDLYNLNTGNPLLKPNFYDNYSFKISAFDYVQLGLNYSYSKNINLMTFSYKENSIQINQSYDTFHGMKNLTLFAGIPVPFKLITNPKNFFKQSLNMEKMSYLYFYTAYSKFKVDDYKFINEIKPIWWFNVISEIKLPKEINISAQYTRITKGTYQIYQVSKPINYTEINLSKTFFNKALKTIISIEDIFNTNRIKAEIPSFNLNTSFHEKQDSRTFWIKLSYNFGKFKTIKKVDIKINSEGKSTENPEGFLPKL